MVKQGHCMYGMQLTHAARHSVAKMKTQLEMLEISTQIVQS